ncbi:MAG TPA: VOC family protein [Candidatus Krumholzibacteria bacterium]|nr:VOC family protein [Candidatus Krumholzibacteria bacterium]
MSDKPGVSINPYSIAGATRIGYVHLRVRDLERSLAFYLDVLGFKLVSGGGHTATLSATGRGPGLLVLTARKDAPARPPRATGLYHFAIRVPNRRALAMMIRHLEDMQWPVQGYADHDVSEAVYLADPDGIGIEVYADRPRDEWPLRNGQVEMVTEPLELDRLMRELDSWPGDWEGLDPATDIGHIHLRVSDLQSAEDFYNRVLGFDVMQRDIAGALFLAAGGYHHHIGVNTWASLGAPRPPADAVGLISFGVQVPDAPTLRELTRRLGAAGAPVTNQDDGGVRAADPDSIFIELFTR